MGLALVNALKASVFACWFGHASDRTQHGRNGVLKDEFLGSRLLVLVTA